MTSVYREDYNVVCFEKIDIIATMNNIASLLAIPNFHFIQGDITVRTEITNGLDAYEIDCVIHTAASSHVDRSFSYAFEFTHNNVIGTHVLLEAVRSHGREKRFLYVSTDEVYGESDGVAVDEKNAMVPTNPYAASKAAAEMYASAYQQSFGIPTLTI